MNAESAFHPGRAVKHKSVAISRAVFADWEASELQKRLISLDDQLIRRWERIAKEKHA